MTKMTEKALKKLIDKAEVSTVEHGKNKHVSVYVADLDREFRFASAESDGDAKDKTLEFIKNESPRIRGFDLDTDKPAEE